MLDSNRGGPRPGARQHIRDLTAHYDAVERIEAVGLTRPSTPFFPTSLAPPLPLMRRHPACHAAMAVLGRAWIRRHRYWFALRHHAGNWVVVSMLHDTAALPGRTSTDPA